MLALIVDDNEEILELTQFFIKKYNDRVILETATSVKEAYKKMEEKNYEIVISDYQMPIKTGIQFLKELRDKGNNIPFIIFTGKGREEIAAEALQLGANRYFQKGGDVKSQFELLTQAIEQEVMYSRTIIEKEKQDKKLLENSKILEAFNKATEEILQIGEQDFLIDIGEIIRINFGLKLFWIGVISKNDYNVHPIASVGYEREYLKKIKITWDNTATGQGPTGMAIKTKKPVCQNNISNDKENYKPWYKEASERGYFSSGAFPLVLHNEVLGTLNLYSEDYSHFTESRQKIYQTLANLLAFFISTKVDKNNIQLLITNYQSD